MDPLVQFNSADRQIMQSYFQLSEALATLIGEHAEIVIHSLNSLESSIIKIINGHHTGRKVGSPITDKGLQLLKKYQQQPELMEQCYFSRSAQGDQIKSITQLIIGSQGKPIGMLCVNLNLSYPFDKLITSFLSVPKLEQDKTENFSHNSQELIESCFDNAQAEISMLIDPQSKQYKKAIVQYLFDNGIFELKDAVQYVADRLQLTKYAIYKHLREFKQIQQQ